MKNKIESTVIDMTPTWSDVLGLFILTLEGKPTATGRAAVYTELERMAKLADLYVAAQKDTPPPPLYTKPREKKESESYKRMCLDLACDLSARVHVQTRGDSGTVEVFAPDGYHWSDGPSSLLAEFDPTDLVETAAVWQDTYERMLDGLEIVEENY